MLRRERIFAIIMLNTRLETEAHIESYASLHTALSFINVYKGSSV